MNINEHRWVKVKIADPTWAIASSAFPCSSYTAIIVAIIVETDAKITSSSAILSKWRHWWLDHHVTHKYSSCCRTNRQQSWTFNLMYSTSVPIKSPCVTFCYSFIVAYFLSFDTRATEVGYSNESIVFIMLQYIMRCICIRCICSEQAECDGHRRLDTHVDTDQRLDVAAATLITPSVRPSVPFFPGVQCDTLVEISLLRWWLQQKYDCDVVHVGCTG